MQGLRTKLLTAERLPRRLATRRLRRIGLRISGKIDAQSKPPPSGHSFQARAKAPPGHPRIVWVPIFAIQTIPASVRFPLGTPVPVTDSAAVPSRPSAGVRVTAIMSWDSEHSRSRHKQCER